MYKHHRVTLLSVYGMVNLWELINLVSEGPISVFLQEKESSFILLL